MKLSLIRFSILLIFGIIFITTTINLGNALQIGLLIMKEPSYWFSILQAGLLCLLIYYGCKWFLFRRV